jgi:voltage-gated potassium channel
MGNPVPVPDVPRRALVLTGLRPVAIIMAMLVLYGFAPFNDHLAVLSVVVTALIGLLIFFGVFVHQIRRIRHSSTPTLTVVEALILVYSVFLIQFAVLYVALSSTDPTAFSEELNRMGGLYLSITVLSTVGFGDITAASDLARLVVSVQMLADLVLLGTAVRMLSTTARKAGAVQAPSGADGTVGSS